MELLLNSLFRIGPSSKFEGVDNKRIVITNYVGFLALVSCAFYTMFFFYYNIYPLNYIFLFFTGYDIFFIRLNQSRYTLISKIGIYIGLLIQVSVLAYLLDGQLNIKTFYIPIIIVPFIIFNSKERLYLLISIAVTIINVVLINSVDFNLEINYNKAEYKWLFASIDVTCISCMVFLAFLFLKLTESSEQQLALKNEELLESKKEQQRLLDLKNKLLSLISHDVKSPLNNFQSLADLQSKGSLSIEQTNYILKGISQSAQDTTILLDNILNWSASHVNYFAPALNQVSIKEIANKVVNDLEYKFKPKGIIILQHIGKEDMVTADRNMLEIVLRNLLLNAIKFSNKGQNIEIITDRKEEKVLIHVIDYGIGIPDQILKKIFDVDHHKSRYGTLNEKGSGFGLLICKEFIELQKGKIYAQSNQDDKTTFTVSLPLN